MAGDAFEITAEGQDHVERVLAALARRQADLTPLFEQIGVALETSTIERFDTGKDPAGKAWEPSQRVRKGAVGEHGPVKLKTGVLSGRLRQSPTYLASADRVEIGTNVVYARRFQRGFDGEETVRAHKRRATQFFGKALKEPIEVAVGEFKRQANQPAREFLGLSSGDREEIVALAADFAAAGLGEIER